MRSYSSTNNGDEAEGSQEVRKRSFVSHDGFEELI
jgi:hypothetical protein